MAELSKGQKTLLFWTVLVITATVVFYFGISS
jgi:hypothetical protein